MQLWFASDSANFDGISWILRQISLIAGASSPSKKGGDQLVDPKKPDGSRAAPTEESENTADKATPSKQEAAPRNMTPTRSEAKKSDLTEKSSAVRDISRSKTPSRSTAKKGATEKPAPVGKDASRSTPGRPAKIVASSEPPSRGGTSRSATPRLKFTPERKVESPNKRRSWMAQSGDVLFFLGSQGMENRYCRYLCPRKRWTRKAGFLEKFSGKMSQIKPCTRTPSPDPKKGRIDSAAQAAIDTREDLGVWRSTPFIDPLAGEGCLSHLASNSDNNFLQ